MSPLKQQALFGSAPYVGWTFGLLSWPKVYMWAHSIVRKKKTRRQKYEIKTEQLGIAFSPIY